MPGIITVRSLRDIGRFGNQLALYCFAKGYAKTYGAELQTPDWIGRELFIEAAKDEPIKHPHLPQTEIDSDSHRPLNRYFGRVDIDLRVFAQHQCYVDYYTREQVRQWFKLKPEWERFAPVPAIYSAAHIRRGDYVDNASYRHSYCAVSDESYDQAIKQFKIPEPVYRVFDGWREPNALLPKHLSWLTDFLLLRDASHLLRANSTFSLFAGWLGHGKVYSPLVEARVGVNTVPFVEGNWPCTAGKFLNQSNLHLKEV